MTEKKSWMDTLSETVDKATKAASEAWDGTVDIRKEAWTKTKEAVNTASDALDEGVELVKAAYKDGTSDEPDADVPVEVDAQVVVDVAVDQSAPGPFESDASAGTAEAGDLDQINSVEPSDDTDTS